MPSKGSRRRNASSRSLFDRRSVVAQPKDGVGAWCPCSLSLALDQSKGPCQGNLVLRYFAQLDGFDLPQLITLRLPLEDLRQMQHGYGNIPSAIRNFFAQDNPIRTDDQVLIISLEMNAPGRVIVPSSTTILKPKDDSCAALQAFQCLCQSTEFVLYVPANDLTGTQMAALQKFNELANQEGTLTSMPVPLRRMYDGNGAREVTWEIFDIPELPPAYLQQPERATSKRAREASPVLKFKRRAIDFSRSAKTGSAAYASNTDTDTDFSAHAFSPQPANLSHADMTKAAYNRNSISTSFDADLVHSAVRDMVQGALPSMVENALSEMLPTVVKTVVQGILPRILHDEIRGLQPGIQQDCASKSSQSSTGENEVDEHPLTALIKPIIQEQLPTVVRQVMDDDSTYDNLIHKAQQQIELVIKEEKDNALDEIRDERDTCVKDVQEAGETSIGEIQEWGVDNNMIAQATVHGIMMRARPTISAESTQSDPLRFSRTRADGEAPASGESTEDVTSVVGTRRADRPPLNRASSITCGDSTETEADIVSEDGDIERNRSSSPTRLSRKLPSSTAATISTRAQLKECSQIPSGSINKLGDEISTGSGGSAPEEAEGKEWQYLDLSPTQADTEMDVMDSQRKVGLGR